MTEPLPAQPPFRWGRFILIIGAVIAIPTGIVQCNIARRPYLAFSEQRAAWHVKCDRYLNTPLTDPAARACNDELNSLVATAKVNGWQ